MSINDFFPAGAMPAEKTRFILGKDAYKLNQRYHTSLEPGDSLVYHGPDPHRQNTEEILWLGSLPVPRGETLFVRLITPEGETRLPPQRSAERK